jgi:hypothetical protein
LSKSRSKPIIHFAAQLLIAPPQQGQEVKKTALSHAQVLGFSDDVVKLNVKAKPTLVGSGIDVDKRIAVISNLKEQMLLANADQEEAKRILKAKTARYTELKHRLYVAASGLLDTDIAAVEKDSDDAKNFRRLRSRITRPDTAEQPAITPVPLAKS